MKGVIDHAHVEAIEERSVHSDVRSGTYQMRADLTQADRLAVSLLMHATDFPQPERWTYQEFFEDVTRTANLFHALGATKDTVFAYILPNLPGKQFVICGGQASGIVAAISPALEPDAIVHLLQAMSDRILVTLSSCGEGGLCRRLSSGLRKGGELDHVVRVDVATGPGRATRSSKLRRSTDGSVSLRSARRRPAHTQ